MAYNDWILDVLADIQSFASANGLGALAEQLDDTKLIAAAEIASQTEKVPVQSDIGLSQPGPDTKGFGRHRHA